MWVNAQIVGGKKLRLDDLSKLTTLEDVRRSLASLAEVNDPRRLRLFYGGKQLEDGHTLYDYSVNQNDTFQVIIKPEAVKRDENKENQEGKAKGTKEEDGEVQPMEVEVEEDLHTGDSQYKAGDMLEWRHAEQGYWLEVEVTKVTAMAPAAVEELKAELSVQTAPSGDFPVARGPEFEPLTYHLKFYDDEDEEVIRGRVYDLRPRSVKKIPFGDVASGDQVLVNFNPQTPKVRGYFYDAIVAGKQDTRTIKKLTCTVFVGADLMELGDCKVTVVDEIYQVTVPGDIESLRSGKVEVPPLRKNAPLCVVCQDDPNITKCKCGCESCKEKKDEDKTLECEECGEFWHCYCLEPPVNPDEIDHWYCGSCKRDTSEVVKAGEKNKVSKKRSKMPSNQDKKTRDWGKGYACSGVLKKCSIVPPNHIGGIPGVEVGSMWLFRVQVSEAGVHRPPVAGISGKASEYSYSIVLSGGYEDDKDDGDSFTYTGSGGRDLSGNKRTAPQSCDQTLTKTNLALAKNCHSGKLDSVRGAKALKGLWKEGKAVRVVRSYKLLRHSKYAPLEGLRYDGLYKVVAYWPQKGASGFKVWRYKLRRDDPAPAPWTAAGIARMEQLGLVMQYPEGYDKEAADRKKLEKKTGKKNKKPAEETAAGSSEEAKSPTPAKKKKLATFQIDASLKDLIATDSVNKKLWKDVVAAASSGRDAFKNKADDVFACIICLDLVVKPVTLPCGHSFCKHCILRSVKSSKESGGSNNCSTCRAEIPEKFDFVVNKELRAALNEVKPGYEARVD